MKAHLVTSPAPQPDGCSVSVRSLHARKRARLARVRIDNSDWPSDVASGLRGVLEFLHPVILRPETAVA